MKGILKMVTKKNWNEFRKTGLLLLVNQFLHIFGWAIVVDYDKDYDKETDDGTVLSVYPARVKFRGFDNKSTEKAYQKISQYMVDESTALLDEANS